MLSERQDNTDCVENEWKGVTRNTNNWDSNKTNMSEVLYPAGLSYFSVCKEHHLNVRQNSVEWYNDWINERQQTFAEYNLRVISSSLCGI